VKIINKSSYPTPEVVKLLWAVEQDSWTRVTTTVRDLRHHDKLWVGFKGISGYTRITVWIGRADSFPIRHLDSRYKSKEKETVFMLNNWQEALVFVFAHEMHHELERRLRDRRLRGFAWNTSQYKKLQKKHWFSEVESDRYGMKRLFKLRETNPELFNPPTLMQSVNTLVEIEANTPNRYP